MAGIATLEQLRSLLRGQGVRTAVVKLLSPKQDNEKNQIYLGGGLDGVTNLFPARIEVRSASESTAKRKSAAGQPKLEARIDFAWLGNNGTRYGAPNTRINDYFQYPEVRMSGFLKGCAEGPDALRREKLAGFGKRILVMGTAADGKVTGLVLTERDDPLVADFPDLPLAGAKGVLRILTIDGEAGADPAELLRHELTAIIRGGWHSSRIKKGDTIVPFTGSQGGGYTLEALLGVAANGNKAPDRHGFEIKSFSGGRISLMTPTPDRGYQGTHTFREFMDRWGHPAVNGDGSLRFFAPTQTGIRDDHALSRLWWNGYIARQCLPDNVERGLELLLSSADVRSNLVERVWLTGRRKLASGIFRAMDENAFVLNSEASFREFMKTVNLLGAGIVFEVMQDSEVDGFLKRCFEEAEENLAVGRETRGAVEQPAAEQA